MLPTLPQQQSCIAITQPGGPGVLALVHQPVPAPAAGQVLLRVCAAGVNRPDCLQRAGHYPPPAGASPLPGLEVSGWIVAVGDGVSPAVIGTAVCALVAGGGYAEYCVAEHTLCLPVPAGMTVEDAAALPETFFTVWSNVFQRGALQAGECLLVQGGASGIGTTAVLLATALGHRVFATAGSDDRCRAVEALGAEVCINHRTEDFVQVIHQHTEGRGVDVVLDMVAGPYVQRELDALADDGRLVVIAFQGGAHATLDVGVLMRRRLTVTGSTLRPRSLPFKAAVAAALRQQVWPLLAQGRARPPVHARFALAEAAAAHALMESGQHIGKILLQVAS